LVSATQEAEDKKVDTTENLLRAALRTKKGILGSLPKRIEIIRSLIQETAYNFISCTLEADIDFHHRLRSLVSKYRVLQNVKHHYHLDNVVDILWELYDLVIHHNSNMATTTNVIPTSIKSFIEYMVGPVTEIKTLLENESSGTSKNGRKQIGEQKAGVCIQDNIDILKIKALDYE